jgi:phosphatidylglycerophosphate synthase
MNRNTQRKILTIPNFLSLTRLAILSPLFVYLAFIGEGNLAFAVGIAAIFSDFLDGYVAIKFNQKSRLGSILDTAGDIVFAFALVIPALALQYIDVWMYIYLAAQRLTRGRIYFYVLRRYNTIYKPQYMKVSGAILMVYGVFLPMLIMNLERGVVDIITWAVFSATWVIILVGVVDTIKKTRSGFFKKKRADD